MKTDNAKFIHTRDGVFANKLKEQGFKLLFEQNGKYIFLFDNLIQMYSMNTFKYIITDKLVF